MYNGESTLFGNSWIYRHTTLTLKTLHTHPPSFRIDAAGPRAGQQPICSVPGTNVLSIIAFLSCTPPLLQYMIHVQIHAAYLDSGTFPSTDLRDVQETAERQKEGRPSYSTPSRIYSYSRLECDKIVLRPDICSGQSSQVSIIVCRV
jgi:hypothetical protein